MVNENKTWFLDFSEKGQMWHIDLESLSFAAFCTKKS